MAFSRWRVGVCSLCVADCLFVFSLVCLLAWAVRLVVLAGCWLSCWWCDVELLLLAGLLCWLSVGCWGCGRWVVYKVCFWLFAVIVRGRRPLLGRLWAVFGALLAALAFGRSWSAPGSLWASSQDALGLSWLALGLLLAALGSFLAARGSLSIDLGHRT